MNGLVDSALFVWGLILLCFMLLEGGCFYLMVVMVLTLMACLSVFVFCDAMIKFSA